MNLVARIEDCFQIANRVLVRMRFLSEDGRIRTKEKIQLRTPTGEVRDTYIDAIAHEKPMREGPPPDPDVIIVSFPSEITKQDVPPGTEIWNFRDE